MSKIKNSGLDQYGTELFEQQQHRTTGVEGVKGQLQPINRKDLLAKIHTIRNGDSRGVTVSRRHKPLSYVGTTAEE